MECFELMEGLNNLPPKQVQTLLENCQSVKVKRLFLYMAEKADHRWFKQLDHYKSGFGKRQTQHRQTWSTDRQIRDNSAERIRRTWKK